MRNEFLLGRVRTTAYLLRALHTEGAAEQERLRCLGQMELAALLLSGPCVMKAGMEVIKDVHDNVLDFVEKWKGG